jgi:hypothetical protein
VPGIHFDATTPDGSNTDTNIRILGIGNEPSRNGMGENGEINASEGSDLAGRDKAFTEEEEVESVETVGDNDSEIQTGASEREFVDPNGSHEEDDSDAVEHVSWP